MAWVRERPRGRDDVHWFVDLHGRQVLLAEVIEDGLEHRKMAGWRAWM